MGEPRGGLKSVLFCVWPIVSSFFLAGLAIEGTSFCVGDE